MTSPLDDALRSTTHAVEQYGVDPDMITLAFASLMSMPPKQRAASATYALWDAIVVLAEAHDGPHDRCETCAAVGNGLAVAMGAVRAQAETEMRRMLGG